MPAHIALAAVGLFLAVLVIVLVWKLESAPELRPPEDAGDTE